MKLDIGVKLRLLELALEQIHFRRRQRRACHLGERGPRSVKRRVELERPPVLARGCRELADELQCCTEVVVISRLARVARDGAAERLDGFGVGAGARHDDADRVERQSIARRERQRLLSGFERLARAMQRQEAAAAVCEVLGFARCEPDRALDDLDGLAVVAVLGSDHAEQKKGVSVLGVGPEYLEAVLVGEAKVAPIQGALRLALPLVDHAAVRALSRSRT
jgi:hypothetical protein